MTFKIILGALLAMVVIPLPLQAGLLDWLGKKEAAVGNASGAPKNQVRRLHMNVAEKVAEKELLAGARNRWRAISRAGS